ncbi:MAG: thioesterase family protein [Marinobacter sp.]|nr:thioesterase family protein [Marinobacter sp.]
MTFDEILADGAAGTLSIDGSWGQGRAMFGGLVAALAFEGMRGVISPGRPMRSLQVSFVGPVEADVPLTVESELLREGKSVSQVQARLVQNGETRLVALGSFGGDRESDVNVPPQTAPSAPGPDECVSLPFREGLSPAFTQHIEMRWAYGSLPFTGKRDVEMGGWMRFRTPPRDLTDAHIVALVDAWPPAVLPHLSKPAPASSLSWALDIVHPRPTIKADEWLLYKATIDQAGSGYGHAQAKIWSAQGELVALSRQTVTVFG